MTLRYGKGKAETVKRQLNPFRRNLLFLHHPSSSAISVTQASKINLSDRQNIKLKTQNRKGETTKD